MTSLEVFPDNAIIPGTVYRVEALIGSGGMGTVYRVEHTELGKRFVLKALRPHLAQRKDLVARMRNEWRALAQLNHPNIVQVTDAGTTASGLPYYVMEHLEGVTLGQLLAERGSLPLRVAGAMMQGVLSGLHAAHQTGAIHRDIKPPNIFVEKSGRAKLLDFGIAKLRDQAARVVTAGGVSIGTPRFMAPEQAEGTKVDGRADIYSAALVLYQILVGKGPFAHITDPNELVMAHISIEPVRADLVSNAVPAEMADLLQRWLAKSPGDRPPTADLARRELEALITSLPADFEPQESEITWAAAAYDAATVGAESASAREAGSVARPPETKGDVAQDAARRPPSAEEAESTVVHQPLTATQTMASEGGGPPALGMGGTLAWGTKQDSMGEAPESRPKRPSYTPPPVSSRAPSALTRRRFGPVGWALATAAVSFGLALGVSRWMGSGEEKSEIGAGSDAKAGAPPGAPVPDARSVPAAPEVPAEETLPSATLAPQIPADSPAPTAPSATTKGQAIPASAPQQPAKSVGAARPAPASSPAGSPGSAPAKAEKGLPGSGLW